MKMLLLEKNDMLRAVQEVAQRRATSYSANWIEHHLNLHKTTCSLHLQVSLAMTSGGKCTP